MFAKEEISALASLYNDIKDVQLESFLTETDLATIENESDLFFNKNKRNGTTMAYRNLRNRMIAPRETNRLCTVVMQRLHVNSDSMTFAEWLDAVAETILYNEDTEVKVGFSFISWKPITNDRVYLFSAKALAPFKFVVDNEEELREKFSKLGSMTDSEILNKTFVTTLSDNPFSKSGFCPLKIVCSYVYITK